MLLRALRFAPFTSLVVTSWLCMAVGGVLGWNMYEGIGLIWRVLIIPSYAVLMAAFIVARPLGSWATIPVFVGILVAGDLVVHGLRRTNRAATDSMNEE